MGSLRAQSGIEPGQGFSLPWLAMGDPEIMAGRGRRRARPQAARRYRLIVPRRWQVDVHYLTEGFEGLCVPTTLDSKKGLMEIMVGPGGEEAAEEVLEALARRYEGIVLSEEVK